MGPKLAVIQKNSVGHISFPVWRNSAPDEYVSNKASSPSQHHASWVHGRKRGKKIKQEEGREITSMACATSYSSLLGKGKCPLPLREDEGEGLYPHPT